jgi:hypothetical protein
MAVTTRQELKDYCLRRLGYPVIEINVDDDQVEDRIQDAIEFWQEYHFDGVERVYLSEQIVASYVRLSTIFAANFQEGETITGTTSGATAIIYKIEGLNQLDLKQIDGSFQNGETITGDQSGFSTTLAASNAFVENNWSLEYFDVSDAVTGIIRAFPVGTIGSSHANTNIFDVVYQFRLNDMYNLLSSDITYYNQVKMHLQLLDDMFAGSRTIRFNRKQNRVHMEVNWEEVFEPGDYVIFEAYRILDPETWTEIYDDMFLKRYATALIKRQWGINMKKFEGMQLPGGITMNGQQVFDEASQEITQIEQEMQLRYELPVDFMVG